MNRRRRPRRSPLRDAVICIEESKTMRHAMRRHDDPSAGFDGGKEIGRQ